jgi:hypothetical protein
MNRHLTDDEISRAIAGQSTLDEQRHLHTCLACGTELARWRQTFAAFRHDVRDRADRATPPVSASAAPQLRRDKWSATVSDTGNRRASALRFTHAASNPVWGIAATLLIAAAALVWQAREGQRLASWREMPRRVIATDQTLTMTDSTVDSANEFFPLAYSTVPITHARIVRMEVPRTAPELFGVDPAGLVNAPRGTVVADVVVGEDGLARAVRFVRLQTSLPKE